ncbi:unnamed protein product [Vitrella brassicaformis CCMP3155]|uniref:Kinesin motor domain-containing protein n=1 Tax=Vitrella brassicaformis (strain CCMP3155) TaxID=1169540 RepID=A0A0G4EF58_VITBC|nr:unnamed protein product [Vitrella brassicaformis CCMP3155]|eukprot:CEL94601.1 unnamed protein product [Vitrella brassicaformis CCMP3155]
MKAVVRLTSASEPGISQCTSADGKSLHLPSAHQRTASDVDRYDFDRIYKPSTDLEVLYQDGVASLQQFAHKGEHNAIILIGPPGQDRGWFVEGQDGSEGPGLFRRCLQGLISESQTQQTDAPLTVTLTWCGFVGERIVDILASLNTQRPQGRLQVVEDAQRGTVVEGLEEYLVDDLDAISGAFANVREVSALGHCSHHVLTIHVYNPSGTRSQHGSLRFASIGEQGSGAEEFSSCELPPPYLYESQTPPWACLLAVIPSIAPDLPIPPIPLTHPLTRLLTKCFSGGYRTLLIVSAPDSLAQLPRSAPLLRAGAALRLAYRMRTHARHHTAKDRRPKPAKEQPAVHMASSSQSETVQQTDVTSCLSTASEDVMSRDGAKGPRGEDGRAIGGRGEGEASTQPAVVGGAEEIASGHRFLRTEVGRRFRVGTIETVSPKKEDRTRPEQEGEECDKGGQQPSEAANQTASDTPAPVPQYVLPPRPPSESRTRLPLGPPIPKSPSSPAQGDALLASVHRLIKKHDAAYSPHHQIPLTPPVKSNGEDQPIGPKPRSRLSLPVARGVDFTAHEEQGGKETWPVVDNGGPVKLQQGTPSIPLTPPTLRDGRRFSSPPLPDEAAHGAQEPPMFAQHGALLPSMPAFTYSGGDGGTAGAYARLVEAATAKGPKGDEGGSERAVEDVLPKGARLLRAASADGRRSLPRTYADFQRSSPVASQASSTPPKDAPRALPRPKTAAPPKAVVSPKVTPFVPPGWHVRSTEGRTGPPSCASSVVDELPKRRASVGGNDAAKRSASIGPVGLPPPKDTKADLKAQLAKAHKELKEFHTYKEAMEATLTRTNTQLKATRQSLQAVQKQVHEKGIAVRRLTKGIQDRDKHMAALKLELEENLVLQQKIERAAQAEIGTLRREKDAQIRQLREHLASQGQDVAEREAALEGEHASRQEMVVSMTVQIDRLQKQNQQLMAALHIREQQLNWQQTMSQYLHDQVHALKTGQPAPPSPAFPAPPSLHGLPSHSKLPIASLLDVDQELSGIAAPVDPTLSHSHYSRHSTPAGRRASLPASRRPAVAKVPLPPAGPSNLIPSAAARRSVTPSAAASKRAIPPAAAKAKGAAGKATAAARSKSVGPAARRAALRAGGMRPALPRDIPVQVLVPPVRQMGPSVEAPSHQDERAESAEAAGAEREDYLAADQPVAALPPSAASVIEAHPLVPPIVVGSGTTNISGATQASATQTTGANTPQAAAPSLPPVPHGQPCPVALAVDRSASPPPLLFQRVDTYTQPRMEVRLTPRGPPRENDEGNGREGGSARDLAREMPDSGGSPLSERRAMRKREMAMAAAQRAAGGELSEAGGKDNGEAYRTRDVEDMAL